MGYPFWAMLALPYARCELPGWGKLLTLLKVYDDPRWRTAPRRSIRGKLHGYLMRVDLAGWSERQTYFLGRYYDLPTQLFLKACLRPGETLIDVGGNIGMLTLLGARLVGEAGRVITFEPNPDCARRIQEALDDNHIPQVTLYRNAVSDEPGELVLSVVTEHTGMGTLARIEEKDQHLVSARHTVQVVRADDVLPDNLAAPVTIKMDIEGFECRGLRGLLNTIRRYRPVVVTEVVGAHLRRAGHSAQELFELMQGEGYRGHILQLRHRLLRHEVSLEPVAPDDLLDCNVAWIYPGSPHDARLKPFVRG